MSKPHFFELEQPAGPPLVEPIDPEETRQRGAAVFASYRDYLRGELARLDEARSSRWQRDYSSSNAYLESIEPMRERFKAMLGFYVDPADRTPLKVADRRLLREDDGFSTYAFRVEVLPDLWTYGLELVPAGERNGCGMIVQHGYGGSPEAMCGFTERSNGEDYAYRSVGIRAARRGYHVVAIAHPTISDTPPGASPPQVGLDPTHHQYAKNHLHRMAVMAGGTLFGIDMLATSRGVDILTRTDGVDPNRIGMYGLSQGGLSALYQPALDTRIRASVCSAYFNSRLVKLIGPHRALCYLKSGEEDKFFTETVRCFADEDVVSLIVPRAFAVEAGLNDTSVDFEKSRATFEFAKVHYEKLGIPGRIAFIPHAAGHVSATGRAFEFLEEQLH